jgi:hypothetical protein
MINIKHIQQQHWSNCVTWTHYLWTIPLVLYICQYIIHFVSYLLYLILNVTLSRYNLIPSHIVIPLGNDTKHQQPLAGISILLTTSTATAVAATDESHNVEKSIRNVLFIYQFIITKYIRMYNTFHSYVYHPPTH